MDINVLILTEASDLDIFLPFQFYYFRALFIILFHVYEYFATEYVCAPYAYEACERRKKAIDPLYLKL